jgi:hypothetical protein
MATAGGPLGRRRRPPPAPDSEDGAAATATASTSTPSLGEFLATAPGIAWLAEELSDVHRALPRLRPPDARELNALVLKAYSKILASDTGRRLASTAHAREKAAEDVLQLPLFIVEDFVRQRLRATLARNWARYALILCTRATVATAAVRCAKGAAQWLLRRHVRSQKARRWGEAALDVLVPTEIYGAMAAVALVAARLHRELSEIQPLPGEGGAGGDGGDIGS